MALAVRRLVGEDPSGGLVTRVETTGETWTRWQGLKTMDQTKTRLRETMGDWGGVLRVCERVQRACWDDEAQRLTCADGGLACGLDSCHDHDLEECFEVGSS